MNRFAEVGQLGRLSARNGPIAIRLAAGYHATRYVAQRLMHTLVVLLGVSLLTFALIHLTPGDRVLVMLGQVGDSIFQRQPVAKLIGDRCPASIELIIAAMLFAVIVGMLTGAILAVFPYLPFPVAAMLIAPSGVAMPVSWLGVLAILLFSLQLGWLRSIVRAFCAAA